MSRNKQIDEMARAMCLQREHCTANSCTGVNCETTWLAENLYNAGYRKASDVAREIFEEIDSLFDKHWFHHIRRLYDEIAELKKKHESEEK